MRHEATHPKFKNWKTSKIELGYAPEIRGNSAMVKGRLFGGAKFFPLSCVNIKGFEIEIPQWLLAKKGLNWV